MSSTFLEAGAISTGLVALAEVGDRTQILGVMLVARFRRPWTILGGVMAASLANHLLAASLGAVAGHWLHGPWMRWILGFSFIAFAVWSLLPEKEEVEADAQVRSKRGVFLTTAVAFFLMEMGDRTQIATAALGARFTEVIPVALGSTLGMMIVNAPSVMLGHVAGNGLPVRALKIGAAILSAGVGVWTLAVG
ncbi:MAG: TMEM165/GDT1 family protein [Caulobacteraceae bacterium]